MAKKPEDIKKQKEKELEKKRKALKKRQKERAKYDSAYAEKIKPELDKKKNIRTQKTDALINKLTSSMFCIPILTVLCFTVLCTICYLHGYKIFSSEFKITGLFHCLYVGDFSIGLSSRLFIGSLLSMFSETITADSINIFAKIALYISLLLQAGLTAVLIKKGICRKNIFIILFALIFILNPVTVCSYTFYFGTLDLYNFIVFLIAAMILAKGKTNLQFIIPILGVVGLLIHYSYFFAFFPAVFVISVYRTVNANKENIKKEAIALGINSGLSIGLFFYLSVFAKNFLFMTSSEMLNYVHQKTDPQSVYIFDDYLNYYLFDIMRGEQMENTGKSISRLIEINTSLTQPSVYIKYLAFISVILIMFWIIWGLLAKKEKGKNKLPFIAAAIMPFALIPELILSSDVWRWIASTVLCQFITLFVLYIKEAPSVIQLFDDIKKRKLPTQLVIILILSAYILIGFFFEHSLYR